MIPITRIARLSHPGVFTGFSWPNDLSPFGRYNVIYGWNGSGKTTISNMLRSLELRRSPSHGEVSLTILGRDVSGTEFEDQVLNIRVFNKYFIEDSVFPLSGVDVPPIFVVGKINVDKQKEVERCKALLGTTQSKLDKARSGKHDSERDLDKFCIDQAKFIKDTLRTSGPSNYNEYNKGDFKRRAEQMGRAGDSRSYELDDQIRDSLLTQHRAAPKAKIPELDYQFPDLVDLASDVANLLSTTVIASAIKSLKDDPVLSSWTYSGLELHQKRQSVKCLFCDQPIPQERLVALEAHFSAEYDNLLNKLKSKIIDVQKHIREATDLALPKAAEFYDDLSAEFVKAVDSLAQERELGIMALHRLSMALNDKMNHMFENIHFDFVHRRLDQMAVHKVAGVIRSHNQATDNFQTRIKLAREKIEAGFVAANLVELFKLQDSVKAAEDEVKAASREVELLNKEIMTLELEIIEHRQPAEELNKELRGYLGHDELQLAVKDTGYAITRNGVPATGLSEGETTAVALLYFLKSLKDRSFDLANGVVVLDDPVSSLDANALYLAFGFIRQRTKDAAQLFILTHNFALFRQIRNWFHSLTGQRKRDASLRPARFYSIECVRDGCKRCSNICTLDPLLEKYESEYHYLFARIYRSTKSPMLRPLEEYYLLPNMARRLLEAFLAFRQPNLSGELWNKVMAVEFEEPKKIRILRFLHTYSHGDVVGEPEHDPSLLAESAYVLNDLMDFIKDQDTDHFAAMKELVDPHTEPGIAD